MARLSREHGAINLGQGAPGEDGPADVIEFAARALTEHSNQYPPLLGLLDLRKALAEHDRRFYGLDLDPEREILIALGATEALACAILALIEPGDEAVLIEPLYDSYLPILKRAGGSPNSCGSNRRIGNCLSMRWRKPSPRAPNSSSSTRR